MEDVRRLGRMWPVWTGTLVTILFGSWLGWRARQPEFGFLEGHRPIGTPERVVNPFPSSSKSESSTQDVYAFAADASRVIREADSQLVAAGWQRDNVHVDWDTDTVSYSEPGDLGRCVSIQKDTPNPTRAIGATDLVVLGERRSGWVGIVISRPDYERDWKSRALGWLNHVFLGRP